jgi:hypothetical protein
MAISINAGEARREVTTFMVDPNELIMHESERGRAYPPTEEEIINLAISIHVGMFADRDIPTRSLIAGKAPATPSE